MTEYKKLCALVEILKENTVVLIRAFEADDKGDTVVLHSRMVATQALITECCPRMIKILRKGREKDPNRQIYNERMCAAIEQLFEDFCAVLGDLLGAPVGELILSEEILTCEDCPCFVWVEDLYSEHMLRLAQTEEWRKRLASTIGDLLLLEEENRAVCTAEERQIRGSLAIEKRNEREAVQQLLDEREAMKWRMEGQRREAEHRGLTLKSKLHDASCALAVLLCVPPPFRKLLISNTLQLVRALRTTPENPNIRRVRCNNLRVMSEYGHVALCDECPICKSVVSSVEVLWYMMGYRVEYFSPPAVHLQTLLKSNPSLCLPCGSLASDHVFTSVGFEDYSERLFLLNEPDAVEEPDEWTEWYARMGEIMRSLEIGVV